jgi:hypothetical protein
MSYKHFNCYFDKNKVIDKKDEYTSQLKLHEEFLEFKSKNKSDLYYIKDDLNSKCGNYVSVSSDTSVETVIKKNKMDKATQTKVESKIDSKIDASVQTESKTDSKNKVSSKEKDPNAIDKGIYINEFSVTYPIPLSFSFHDADIRKRPFEKAGESLIDSGNKRTKKPNIKNYIRNKFIPMHLKVKKNNLKVQGNKSFNTMVEKKGVKAFNSYLAGIIESSATIETSNNTPTIYLVFPHTDKELAYKLYNFMLKGVLHNRIQKQGSVVWEIHKEEEVKKIFLRINGFMRTPKIEDLYKGIDLLFLDVKREPLDTSPLNSNS